MNEQTDKYLDQLAKKVMKDAPLETPSFDFTNTVMSQVSGLSHNKVIAYKPLISKTGWIFILVGFLILVFFVLFGNQTSSSGWLNTIDFSMFSNNGIAQALSNFKIPSFTISKTLTYAIVLFGVMVCIQISFLKHHFNQRFEN
ncbi:hypothetical protein CJ739_2725 [Mariniflexile rhizosphaerae]|uniref:hypothetical protein n=1 Tax=unclassified Mariniflexile TaxID=2643887 RepID=UPI000CB77E01|nr:hypothetical protein [Mariniflexile sp. TRM1-10]AXP81791.1 hypothetical protein CJ739_2725 [Mariniflexile sp. TRM1-10]PLB20827.1 MAG: hypothetical protein TRG1_395 [Flavobacteriaceae bacterium FS1-H7996/R]